MGVNNIMPVTFGGGAWWRVMVFFINGRKNFMTNTHPQDCSINHFGKQ